jgi:hypothetical protein
MKRILRPRRVWVAPAVVAVALLAACGADDPGDATSAAAPERANAPVRARLEAQAEQYERLAQLQGQARTYGAAAERQEARPSPTEAGNQVLAERMERSVKLEGQARTHGKTAPSDDAPTPADETLDGEFVPGSRHMPTR